MCVCVCARKTDRKIETQRDREWNRGTEIEQRIFSKGLNTLYDFVLKKLYKLNERIKGLTIEVEDKVPGSLVKKRINLNSLIIPRKTECVQYWLITFWYSFKWYILVGWLGFMAYQPLCCIAIIITLTDERTHFIKIYLSHFILERVDVSVVCKRWMETRTDCYIDPHFSLHAMLSSRTHIALFLHLDWGCSTGGRWGQQPSGGVLSLQAGSYPGLPVINWLNSRQHLPIFFHNAHLLPLLLPLIYTGASLIDGSVKGHYITLVGYLMSNPIHAYILNICDLWKNTLKVIF